MGSFNTSCFVTKQVIRPIDEVIIFPIAALVNSKNKFNSYDNGEGLYLHKVTTLNHEVHFNSTWNVIGKMMTAVYDDYGMFKIDDTVDNMSSLIHNLLYIKKHGLDIKSEYYNKSICLKEIFQTNKSSSIDFKMLNSIWNGIYEIILADDLFIKQDDDCYQIKIAVVSKYAFNYIVDENKSKSWFVDIVTKDIKYFYENMQESELYVNIGIHNILNDSKINIQSLNVMCDRKLLFNDNDIDLLRDVYRNDMITAEQIYTMVRFRFLFYTFLIWLDDMIVIKLEPMSYLPHNYENKIGEKYLQMVNTINLKIKVE